MDHKLTVVLLLALFLAVVHANSIVSGNVFCDQCLHGKPSMWGIPIRGARVHVRCTNRQGRVMVTTAFTNFLGAFVARFPGTSDDLQHCTSRLLSSPMKQCNVASNAQESLRLEWRLYQNTFYTVKPLYFRPVKPMPICPVSHPVVAPLVIPKAPTFAPTRKEHRPSFCRPDHWINPLYKCHWKLLSPEQEVAKVLGEKAGKKFGKVSLMQALAKNTTLNGVGDEHYSTIYNELLSQTVAALLNSYFSSNFNYSPLTITRHFDDVMKRGTPRDAKNLAAELRKLNAGVGKGTCLLDVCKNI